MYVLFVMETQTWAIPAVPIAQSARKSGQITQSAHAPPTLAEVSLEPYVGYPSAQEDQSNHLERTRGSRPRHASSAVGLTLITD